MKARYITPAVTAFTKERKVDMEANKKIYDHLIQNGMDGILILGSIGEFFAIPLEEKKQMIQEALAYINKRTTVYVGTASNVMEECVGLSQFAIEHGADGVMVISPYYFNLPESSVFNFYDTLAKRIDGPLLLYNFPARTGYDLSPQLVLELVRNNSNIIGIKDTVALMGHTRSLIQRVKSEFPKFLVFSGFDEFFTHNVISGGDGCIAGISNFAPEVASALVKATNDNNIEDIQKYQRKIDQLMDIYDVGEQFIPIIKMAMKISGLPIEETCAAPMLPANEREIELIRHILRAMSV